MAGEAEVVKAVSGQAIDATEFALGMVAGAVGFYLLDSYLGITKALPAQVQPFAPALAGAAVIVAGYYAKNRIVMGVGAGMIAYNVVVYLAPIAISTAAPLAAKAKA